MTDSQPWPRPGGRGAGGPGPGEPGPAAPAGGPGRADLAALLGRVARGDDAAYGAVYGQLAAPVFGVARSVLRDPAQAEEVAQEVLLDVWRDAARYDASRGSAKAWVMTLAHRRAVDRVRSEQATAAREQRAARAEVSYDVVAETVAARLDAERVRRCLGSLTDLQQESVTLAYYRGCTYREVAALLKVPVGTVKTRMRDGLIRLRDCLGVD
ncbi:MAG TPA: ECF RNA polymerase sigma factor SigK [Streptosporangiaceae bacterium]|jgi:RNA polymerase sigma-70 factor (ECF subfamily)